MLRLQGLGSNILMGVLYTEDEIIAIVRGGKQRGNMPGVRHVFPRQGMVIHPPSQSTHSADNARLKKSENGSDGCEDDELGDDEDINEDEDDEDDS
nr:hypothetical protein [Tanacetum cinerariifolium]